ncbi:DUF456 domain-containing protein [bacterium]|nr:DUF456 domain-containing protein [bacterium]
MNFLLWVVTIIFIFVGISGVMLPALPGIPLAFIGFLIGAWIDGFQKVGWFTVIILAVLTVLSILLDFLVSTLGAKRMGASFFGMTGAVVGTIIGLFFGLTGLVFGPFIGAVAGELLSKKNLIQAGKVGIGTWIGLVIGIAVKMAVISAMIGIFLLSYFF